MKLVCEVFECRFLSICCFRCAHNDGRIETITQNEHFQCIYLFVCRVWQMYFGHHASYWFVYRNVQDKNGVSAMENETRKN